MLSSRVAFFVSGLLACLSLAGAVGEPRALANKKDYRCDTIIRSFCPCTTHQVEQVTFCCPRGQYGPMLFSCQSQAGSECVDTTAGGQPLMVPCPGFLHSGTCGAAPQVSCFRMPRSDFACPADFGGTCAP